MEHKEFRSKSKIVALYDWHDEFLLYKKRDRKLGRPRDGIKRRHFWLDCATYFEISNFVQLGCGKHTIVVVVETPGMHTQLDVKHLPHLLPKNEKCYVYNFVDHASRWEFKRAFDS